MTPEARIAELERKLARLERVMRVNTNRVTFTVPVVFRKATKIDRATIYAGYGSPENVQSGRIGSLFLRLDGGAGTTLYVKESGFGRTGWSTTA